QHDRPTPASWDHASTRLAAEPANDRRAPATRRVRGKLVDHCADVDYCELIAQLLAAPIDIMIGISHSSRN
ncbi:hypothetical protein, partial [Mycobacterium sp.]|uniref:hypothetical protein n=1 Tax=Mycobacterium sp. TaxID=1785 RepID=UPI0031D9E597